MTEPKNATLDELPEQLPEKPEGWTQQFCMHLHFGRSRHVGVYAILDPHRRILPIGRQYDTSDPAATGFTLPGVKECMTWRQLRETWPRWLAAARAKVARRKEQQNPSVVPT